MRRRRFIAFGCAQCALLASAGATAADDWVMPPRLARPALDSDEGGLWALMDREEKRVRRSPFRLRDEALDGYLAALVCRLGAEHCPDIRVYPLRTPWFNASMAPNGMMQIWSGLMLRADNEAQLAAIVGHEMGHYLQRHAAQNLRDLRSRAAFAQFLGIVSGGVVGLLGQLALLAGQFAFSREQEREADAIGLALMSRAGYDGREAAKIWANLRTELQAAGEDPAAGSPMFATHPAAEERERTLREKAAGSSGDTGLAAWRRHIEPFMPTLLQDELRRARPAQTLVLIDRLIARDGHTGHLLLARGEAYRMRAAEGDTALAIAAFEQALERPDAPAEAYREFGIEMERAGHKDKARDAYRRYLAMSPAAPDAAMIGSYLQGLAAR